MTMIDSFGRPGALAGPIDDMADAVAARVEAQIDAWAQPKVKQYANDAYDTFRARFEKDKQVLVDEIIVAAKPGLQKAAGEITRDVIDDPRTQERLDALEAQLGNKVAKALVVTAVTTAALTWGLITFLPKPRYAK